MRELLEYIVANILGSDDFTISQEEVDGHIQFTISTIPDFIGLLIGKQGRTIKAIRNIVKIKAVLENKSVNVSVDEAN